MEVFLGRPVTHGSGKKVSKSRRKLEAAMEEVHENIPSTVKRANVSGKRREKMLRAIAFDKAREAGAHLPRKRS